MKQKRAQQAQHGHNKPVVKAQAQYRTRVTCGRVSGKVASWQGEEGWIRPDAKIDHGLSSKNSGLVVVRRKDVSAGQALKPGEAVDFLVYSEVAEGGRLGAEFCRLVPGKSQPSPDGQGQAGKPQPPQPKSSPVKPLVKPAQKVLQLHLKKPEVPTLKKPEPPTLMKPVPKKGGKPKGATLGKSGKPPIQNVTTTGKDGKKSGAATTPGKGPPATAAKGYSANAMTAAPPSADGFKAKSKLPRQQIGTAEQSGQLHEWWGKYGWIIPDKPVNHPGASKRQGKVYVHLSDMEDDSMTVIPGCRVSFLLYVDNSGLGAQNCRIVDNLPAGKGLQNAGPKTGYNKWQSTGYQQADGWQSQSQEAQEEEGLPPDWEEHWSDEYNVPYFWNKKTKESVWVRPQ